ncbi:unnamed protein product [Lupinus luteus]|uniref:GH18 domain-containing protein n=1 Tax=Lupinus luteus TaxID=3873 RepID=A0AAV1YJT7_LUPLU
MASTKQPRPFLLLLAFLTLSFIMNSATAAECAGSGDVSVYWGQHSDDATEGTLEEACDSGIYNILIISTLIVYDNGNKPTLNLANHCGSVNSCSKLEGPIKHCQDLGIKVFLSIGLDESSTKTRTPKATKDDGDSIVAPSEDVSKNLADYILENYLSGNHGPLGNVSLDGIDLGDVADSEHLKWDELVKAINGSTTERKIYLSASPECVYPDYYLGTAIRTGLFDYIWVEFYYQNPCIYSSGSAEDLIEQWKVWTSDVPNSKIFLGLTATNTIAGYIEPHALKSDVLPFVKEASNYGGIMIWDRYHDRNSGYSEQIKDSVQKGCRCVCDEPASANFYGLQARPFSF